MDNVFDRSKHVYQSDAFEEIIKDTVRFFNGTPVHKFLLPKILSVQGFMLCIILE